LHRAVRRERLYDKLDDARRHCRAVCVVGPPGAGKTTLVASWLDARAVPGIWYQVDSGDADLATFFYYLGLAARSFARPRQRPLPALTPEYLHDIPTFARRFFRELFQCLPPASALVLDNYQEVPADLAFHAVIADAIGEVPDGRMLLCVTRRDPPDCYARLIVNEAVNFLDWEDLKLRLEEAHEIVQARTKGASADVHVLHSQSGGWAAGFVLMLEHAGVGSGPVGSTHPRDVVFGYFAAQIFERISAEVRQLLIATADLPWVEPELGEALSGVRNAARILDDLCRRHLFTHQRAGPRPSYQYHALFQEFLRAQADASMAPGARAALRVRAGELLETAGSAVEAFGLYCQAQAWERAAGLVLAHAERLIGQGRFRTLADWVAALPRETVEAEPWLSYWHGRAQVPLDPTDGRRHLERAYEGFARRGDPLGEAGTAASIIDSIYIENRHFVAMDPWIAILERTLPALDRGDASAMEIPVYSSALVAMLYRQPGHALVPACLTRLTALLELDTDPDSRVGAAVLLMSYASASGDFSVGHRVRALIEPIADRWAVAPARRFLWRLWLGYFFMLTGDYAEAEASYQASASLNEENRFPWAANLMFCRALSYCSDGDQARALPLLDGLVAVSNRARPQDMGYLHVAQAWKGMVTDDPHLALRESEAAVAIAEQIGNFTLNVIWRTPKMWALVALGRDEQFVRFMESTLALVQSTCFRRPHVELLAMQTWMLLRQGRRDDARSALRETLILAKQLDHDAFFHRLCHFAPELRSFALGMAEERLLVDAMIRRFRWPAPAPTVVDWPWRVRVFTLGRFEVLVDGVPLTFGRKTPRKPLLLLKALVAFGGQQVAVGRLLDALWPEEAGDAAHHALGLTLHRLRRLLRDADTVLVADGALSLNRDWVWCDAQAFEQLAREDALESSDAATQVAGLYRGDFLAEDSEAPWTASARERLRARFLHFVEAQGRALEEAGRLDDAIWLYLRGLDSEPVAERLYQGLIRCYAMQGRRADALATYRRLRQLLSVVLGVQPSTITETLARGL
jgi:DNA-binding SARP family transcriptional activator